MLEIFLHQELYACLLSGPWVIINAVGAISLMHEFVRLVTKYTVSRKLTFVIIVLCLLFLFLFSLSLLISSSCKLTLVFQLYHINIIVCQILRLYDPPFLHDADCKDIPGEKDTM